MPTLFEEKKKQTTCMFLNHFFVDELHAIFLPAVFCVVIEWGQGREHVIHYIYITL